MTSRALALLLALSLPAAALAEPADDSRREADADSCQGDVHRLCDKFFPDEKLVATCLIDRRAELSPACADALAHPPGDDEAAAPPARPGPGFGPASR